MLKRSIFITAVLVLLWVVLRPSCVYACSCVIAGPPDQMLAESDAVFAGRVVMLNEPAPINEWIRGSVTFAVSRTWEGEVGPTVVLRTYPASTCEYTFTQGEEYLVYATTFEGQLATDHCTRTAPLAAAEEDIAVLGAGAEVFEEVSTRTAVRQDTAPNIAVESTDNGRLVIAVIVLVVLLAAGGALVVMRRPHDSH